MIKRKYWSQSHNARSKMVGKSYCSNINIIVMHTQDFLNEHMHHPIMIMTIQQVETNHDSHTYVTKSDKKVQKNIA